MEYLSAHPFIISGIAAAVAALVILVLIFNLYRRWNSVFGPASKNEAGIVVDFSKRLIQLEEALNSLQPRVDVLEAVSKVSVQKVGFKRFNPFGEVGGDQSFSLALLDRESNGVIISSLYTREGVRVYAKEVKNGVSKHSLSDEEKEVLNEALKANPNPKL